MAGFRVNAKTVFTIAILVSQMMDCGNSWKLEKDREWISKVNNKISKILPKVVKFWNSKGSHLLGKVYPIFNLVKHLFSGDAELVELMSSLKAQDRKSYDMFMQEVGESITEGDATLNIDEVMSLFDHVAELSHDDFEQLRRAYEMMNDIYEEYQLSSNEYMS